MADDQPQENLSKAQILDAVKKRQRSKKKSSGSYGLWIGGSVALVASGILMMIIYPNRGLSEIPVNDAGLIGQLNSGKEFKVSASSFFEHWSMADVNRFGGVEVKRAPSSLPACQGSWGHVSGAFDARKEWPKCFQSAPYDSGNCTSSWAVAAVSAFSDRRCIKFDGSSAVLSPQSVLSCDSDSEGCQGGDGLAVWEYLKSQGAVSQECFPFTPKDVSVGCEKRCPDEAGTKLEGYCNPRSDGAIMQEISKNGPLVAPIFLYDDFLVYSSGVYKALPTSARLHNSKKTNYLLHMVKVVGWGQESDGTDYWIIENSWGTSWGIDGYAKIARNAGGDKFTVLLSDFIIAPIVSGKEAKTEEAAEEEEAETGEGGEPEADPDA